MVTTGNNLKDLVDHGGLSVHVAVSLFRSYVMSASQHVLRNNFATKQQAAEYDGAVLHTAAGILGKPVDALPATHLPVKHAGVNIAIAEDRCHLAIWSAWLASIPTIMRVFNVTHVDEFVAKCPTIGDQLGCIQKSVSDSTGLRTLGLQPLAVALKNLVQQKKLAERAHALEYKRLLDQATPAEQALIRSSAASGAASFLEVPRQREYLMSNARFVTSFFRRLFAPGQDTSHPPLLP